MTIIDELGPLERELEILFVDDRPEDIELMERELRKSAIPFRPQRALRKREVLTLLGENVPDLVITDFALPDSNGLEILGAVREVDALIPVIVVTGAVDERTAAACIREGAADYVLKDHLTRLPIAALNAVERARSRASSAKAQAALRQSESRFRMVAESAGDGILVVDEQGEIEFINRAAEEMFGYSEEEILGKEIEVLLPSDLREAHRAARKRAIAKPDRGRVTLAPREFEGLRRDGTRFPLELSVAAWEGEEGIRMSSVVRDISHRKAAETLLKESEERYRLLVEHLPVVTFSLTLDRRPRLVFVSSRVESLLGETAEEWLRDPTLLSSRIDPRDRRMVLRAVRQARTTGILKELTFRMLDGDGEIRWVRAHATSVDMGRGQPVLQGLLRDISDLKRTELERNLLSAAVEQSGSMVIITDVEGRTFYANPAFEELTGFSREDVIGKNPRLLLGGSEREDEDSEMWKALRRGEAWEQEFQNRRKDGTLLQTRANISPLHDEQGRVTHMVGISQDITAVKEMEAQIRQIQKMETVGQLTGGIAHDMNNILTAVMSYAALAKAGLEARQTEIAEDLEEVHQAANRGAEMIRKLMAFSRRDHLRFKSLDAAKVTKGLEGMLVRLLPENIRISLEMEEGAWCRADEGALEQILVNLATNGRDAMPESGELRITVDRMNVDAIPPDATHRPPPGPFVRIQVNDTGCGMSEAVRQRFFEPFFTTKAVGQGTGLGTSVVHGLVGQHGGFLTLQSSPGKGTTVSVFLPFAPERVEREKPALPPTQHVGRERILLVEDDGQIRSITKRLLTRAGYDVRVAQNGMEALEALAAGNPPPDLVLTDVMLPELTGIELYQKAKPNGCGPAFLFTSGYTQEELDLEQKGLGHVPVLSKPWDPKDMLGTVRAVIDAPRVLGTEVEA